MKNLMVIALSLIFLFYSFNSKAETAVKSKIKSVVVYKNGGKVTREANAKLGTGNNQVVFTGLSTSIQANSIQLGLSKDVKLVSLNYRINYLKDAAISKEIRMVLDSIALVNKDLGWISKQKEILVAEQELLRINNKLGSSTESMKVDELRQLHAYYSEKMMGLAKDLYQLGIKESDLRNTINRLKRQYSQLSAGKSKASGEIVAEISSKTSGIAAFELSYVVNGVSWSPLYDMYSDGLSDNVSIVYKANVSQSSGIDWENVDVIISTSNPNTNNSRPVLNPRYISYYVANKYVGRRSEYDANKMYKNTMVEMEEVVVKENAKPAPSRGSYIPATMTENQLNVEFKVDQKYNIPSDGQTHLVNMVEFKLPASYEYQSVPLLDKGAFLIAGVTNWSAYNLLPAQANIFFNNAYIGQSWVDPNITADTLLLSFGRDERVIVKREKVQSECTTKNVLNVKKHKITYEIEVKNTKSKAISIKVLDQIPLSNLKDVSVELIDKGGAVYNEKTGGLLWTLNLKPNESIKLRFSYEVKQPKGLSLTNL